MALSSHDGPIGSNSAARAHHGLLEIIEDRYQNGSILVASQLPVKDWHGHLGGASIAHAILDRLLHGSHLISLQGGSMRKTPLS